MLAALGVAQLLFAGPELQSCMRGTVTKFPNPKSWAASSNFLGVGGHHQHVRVEGPTHKGFKRPAVWHAELQQHQYAANSL